ncbi:SUMO-activating enzyme subunit 1 isoform X2 [Ammospiza caudacuta]|uniref:SUMO-activating enzyme subunit 1 isoform X2 n=1 Tax=Ammospiza caudacuta TaxID=2857398 RepID=UPI0027393224|nr:SUMO-activating enzyme subunit 1 isoform X2 [Ammospiza caudacuta]
MVEKDESSPGGISEEEAAQYDRQIRLWGLEAQKRLRASRVLLVGLRGLGAEVAKNLILAGVRGLTLLDHQQVSPEDSRAQFLIPAGSQGRNRAEASLERAQSLNPMVEVKADPESVESKPSEFFTQFDAVCLTCCSKESMVRINQICHKNGVKFFSGDVFGYHGFMFCDLGLHEFVEEKPKVPKGSSGLEDGPEAKRARLEAPETTMVKKQLQFCPLREALAVQARGEEAAAALQKTAPDYFLLHASVSRRWPRCAPCSGGCWARRWSRLCPTGTPPHNNFFFFDGVRGQGVVERLGPPPQMREPRNWGGGLGCLGPP